MQGRPCQKAAFNGVKCDRVDDGLEAQRHVFIAGSSACTGLRVLSRTRSQCSFKMAAQETFLCMDHTEQYISSDMSKTDRFLGCMLLPQDAVCKDASYLYPGH